MKGPSQLTSKEWDDRTQMAMAEVGYGWAGSGLPHPPLDVRWRAGMVVEPAIMPCWPCYSACDGMTLLAPPCEHDALTSPWPGDP